MYSIFNGHTHTVWVQFYSSPGTVCCIKFMISNVARASKVGFECFFPDSIVQNKNRIFWFGFESIVIGNNMMNDGMDTAANIVKRNTNKRIKSKSQSKNPLATCHFFLWQAAR